MLSVFRKAYMAAAAANEGDPNFHGAKKGAYEWKKEHLSQHKLDLTEDTEGRSKGIPVDIDQAQGRSTGPAAGNEDRHGKNGGVRELLTGNPGVFIGMGLTTLALMGMFKSSLMGNKMNTQKMMQLRIAAQFFTVACLVAGAASFGYNYTKNNEQKADSHGLKLAKQDL